MRTPRTDRYLVTARLSCVLLALASGGRWCRGDDFRIETKIFVGDEPQPVSRNLTLFHQGVVYDFLADPEQIAVFRHSVTGDGGRFILLDPQRKVRAEISSEKILTFLNGLRAWAASQNDPLLTFAAHPDFKEAFDPVRGELRLESDVMRYFLTTEEPRGEADVALYHEFSDWYGRLGAVTHVGSLPPFPRLAVNNSLARHHRIPRTVRLTIPARRPYRTNDVVMRAEHTIRWRLARQDQQRIERVGEQLVEFKLLPYEEFQLER